MRCTRFPTVTGPEVVSARAVDVSQLSELLLVTRSDTTAFRCFAASDSALSFSPCLQHNGIATDVYQRP